MTPGPPAPAVSPLPRPKKHVPHLKPLDEEEDEDRPRRRRSVAGTSGKAVASLVLGILSFLAPVLLSIFAVLLGLLGLREINRSNERLGGRGLAITGLVTGLVSCLMVIPIFYVIQGIRKENARVEEVRNAASKIQSLNNLKNISLAMHNFNDTYKRLPPAVVYSQDGRPLYSWRVLLLPFLEEGALYAQFKLNEPWDSPNNIQLLSQMPKIYKPPVPGKTNEPHATFYQAFDGPGAAFESGVQNGLRPFPLAGNVLESGQVMRIPASFPDGTSNTIMFVEAAEAVPWTKPADVPFNPNLPLPKLGGLFTNGFCVGMADASAVFIPRTVSETTLRAAITRNGGEELGADWPR
jgi:hypothetical protein